MSWSAEVFDMPRLLSCQVSKDNSKNNSTVSKDSSKVSEDSSQVRKDSTVSSNASKDSSQSVKIAVKITVKSVRTGSVFRHASYHIKYMSHDTI